MSKFTSAFLKGIDPFRTSTYWIGNSMDKKRAKKEQGSAPKLSSPKLSSPTVGEDTVLKPGQRTNLINTSPQGVLTPASSNRDTLLGG